MLDLAPQHVAIVRSIVSRHLPNTPVWVFGSRINGRARRFSDLDLVVKDATPIDMRIVEQIQEALDKSDLPILVDIVDWHRLPAHFQSEIALRHQTLLPAQGV